MTAASSRPELGWTPLGVPSGAGQGQLSGALWNCDPDVAAWPINVDGELPFAVLRSAGGGHPPPCQVVLGPDPSSG